MTTTLGAFHTLLSSGLGRGTSLDSEIPTWVESGVKFLERNYSFQYMRRWTTITVDADSANPHIISLAGLRVKKVELIRIWEANTAGDGGRRFTDLGQINPADRTTRPAGDPSAFWLDGVSNIVLDSTPDADKDMEGHFVLYSDWNKSSDTFTHWLLDEAFELVYNVSMMYLAIRVRDPKLYQFYQSVLMDSLKSFNLSEEELRFGAEASEQMWTPMNQAWAAGSDPGRDNP